MLENVLEVLYQLSRLDTPYWYEEMDNDGILSDYKTCRKNFENKK